jgi:uncharacterized YigZ family protein
MFSDDTYRTIAATTNWVYKEKSSKFLTQVIPVTNEDEVNEALKSIKKDYFDANHRCFAYRLGFNKELYRYSDDGEPSGTAGKPIYGQLLSFDLTNVLIVVIRYFGGTKLGVSGLINAYRTSSREAILSSEIITKTINDVFDIEFAYEYMNDVMKLLKENNIKPMENNYENRCGLRFSVRKIKSDLVIEKLKKINNLTYKHIQII